MTTILLIYLISPDYNRAFKMYEGNKLLGFLSSEEIEEGIGYAKKDWQCFFASMCSFTGIKFDFYIPESDESFEMLMKNHLSNNILGTMVGVITFKLLIVFFTHASSIRTILNRHHLRKLIILDCEKFLSSLPNMLFKMKS